MFTFVLIGVPKSFCNAKRKNDVAFDRLCRRMQRNELSAPFAANFRQKLNDQSNITAMFFHIKAINRQQCGNVVRFRADYSAL